MEAVRQGKHFFFEKKKQKTFAPLGLGRDEDRGPKSVVQKTNVKCYYDVMKRDDAIEMLKANEARLKRAGVEHLYLFGSTARDEEREGSDIDLFFDYDGKDFGLIDLMDVKALTVEILGTKTDMIPRDALHQVLRARIEASALQVF